MRLSLLSASVLLLAACGSLESEHDDRPEMRSVDRKALPNSEGAGAKAANPTLPTVEATPAEASALLDLFGEMAADAPAALAVGDEAPSPALSTRDGSSLVSTSPRAYRQPVALVFVGKDTLRKGGDEALKFEELGRRYGDQVKCFLVQTSTTAAGPELGPAWTELVDSADGAGSAAFGAEPGSVILVGTDGQVLHAGTVGANGSGARALETVIQTEVRTR